MFENIIAQRTVVERLRAEIAGGLFAPALLFHGPEYSGKSSCALELARVLTCTGVDRSVPWGCNCRPCVQNRHLLHPEVLMVGGRYFVREVSIAAASLARDPRPPLRFLLERSVRKLTRRFDPLLWEGEEARLRKVDPLLASLDEALGPYLPDTRSPDGRASAEGLETVVELCGRIAQSAPLDAVPVSVVRRISHWVRMAAAGPAKVVIIENMDRLHESARNALLKTLEEPPAGVHFVMTTSRRTAVIPTILSRSRSYGFTARDRTQTGQVISSIFRDDPDGYASLRDYFLSAGGPGVRDVAQRFIESCMGAPGAESGLFDDAAALINSLGGAEGFRRFLEELAGLLDELLRAGSLPDRHVLERWRALLAQAAFRVGSLNVGPALALEGLYYRMRAAA